MAKINVNGIEITLVQEKFYQKIKNRKKERALWIH
jgi:hypothetical protein